MKSNFKKVTSRHFPICFKYIFLSFMVILVLIPIVMLAFGALKTRGAFMTHPHTPPIPPYWGNILNILSEGSFWRMMGNSLFVMAIVTFAVVAVCSMAAFVFSRLEFRYKGWLFSLFTIGLMFPINVAILPVYFVLRQIGLLDSLWGIIVVQLAFQISGNIMILRGFFTAVPAELQEAAYIDGASVFYFFWRIMLPLVRPSLAAVAALTMIVSWNDLLVPLVVLTDDKLWTLTLGTMQFQGQFGQDLALVSTFVLLSAIPTILFYLIAERQIVAGLTAGAVKN